MESDGNKSVRSRSAETVARSDALAAEDACAELIARLSGRRSPFDRYLLQEQIAEGGMGRILKARDEDLRRDLAMKVLRGPDEPRGESPRSPSRSRQLARFLEEAQITGQLDHPGIVPVHELGLDPKGRLYFTMKLVRGKTLREVFDLAWKREDGWSTTRVLGVLLKVCEAMSYAHEHRVIHRDLKPANIMVGRFGEVLVMDWGLARLLDGEDPKDIRVRERPSGPPTTLVSERHDGTPAGPDSPLVTMDGDVLGTPAYMSPEQASGHVEAVGIQTDVYAIGAILYHLLTQRMPYVAPGARVDNYAVWRWVQEGPPTAVHALAPRTSEELVAICEKAMERNPARRYAGALELAEDLRAYLENRTVRAHPVGPVVELRKWVARNRSAAASIAAVLIVALLAAIGIAWERSKRADEATRSGDEHAAASLLSRSRASWPIDPERLPEIEAWLSDARDVVSRGPRYAEELATLTGPARDAGRARETPRESPPALLAAIADARNRAQQFQSVLTEYREGRNKSSSPHDPEHAAQTLEILPAEIDFWSSCAERLAASNPTTTIWTFDRKEEQQHHDRLAALVRDVRELETTAIPAVERLHEEANSLRERTIVGASQEWGAAIDSIADRSSCPLYEGLRITPQLGLVPLRRDPASGLWEFWHASSGERPDFDGDGGLSIRQESGIVLVLIPGGTVLVGAQRSDAKAPRHDPLARATELVQRVELAPYFISKYELTQAQWLRATGEMPSHYMAGNSIAGTPRISRLHPVERVSWDECIDVLGSWGLTLPTEAQWERAARGNTDMPYGSAASFELIADKLNFKDVAAGRVGMSPSNATKVDDGFGLHAPIGRFAPNPFGLLDALGNVSEWCLDAYADSCDKAPPRNGDGQRSPPSSRFRVMRGGGFKYGSTDLRMTTRFPLEPDGKDEDLGVRAARRLEQ